MKRAMRRAWRQDEARRRAAKRHHPRTLIETRHIMPVNTTVASVADSGVYAAGDGYERLELFTHWDPRNPRRVARIHIRIDRQPSKSYANVDIWTEHGFICVISWSSLRFWGDLPGYDRAHSPETARLVRRLTEQLVTELLVLADVSDI